MTFGQPTTPLERAAACAVADVLGRDAPPWWSLETQAIGIHPDNPQWAYVTVRVPMALGLIVDELGKAEAVAGA